MSIREGIHWNRLTHLPMPVRIYISCQTWLWSKKIMVTSWWEKTKKRPMDKHDLQARKFFTLAQLQKKKKSFTTRIFFTPNTHFFRSQNLTDFVQPDAIAFANGSLYVFFSLSFFTLFSTVCEIKRVIPTTEISALKFFLRTQFT